MNPLGEPNWWLPGNGGDGLISYNDADIHAVAMTNITTDAEDKLEVQREKADNAATLLAEAESDLARLRATVNALLESDTKIGTNLLEVADLISGYGADGMPAFDVKNLVTILRTTGNALKDKNKDTV